MVDISDTTGSKTSRSGRGSANVPTSGGTSTRSQDFARTIAEPRGFSEARGLQSISQALTSFFPAFNTIGAMAEREGIVKAQQDNRKAITEAENLVQSDLAAVREARKTGDVSKFIPPGYEQRQVVEEGAAAAVGRRSAYDLAEDIKSVIRGTELDGDPVESAEKFLNDEAKGMSPVMALTFRDTTARLVDKEVATFNKSRLTLQQLQADIRSKKVVQDQIVNDHIPLTAEGIDTVRQQVIGSMPRTAPDAVLRAGAIVDDTIISMAAQGNSKAVKLLHTVDPKRGGTSIYDRNRAGYEKALAGWITQQEKFQTVEALESMQGLEGRFDDIEAGVSEDDTLESLWVDLQSYGQAHGKQARFRTLRSKLASKLDSEGIRLGNLDLIAKGKAIGMSTADWNKVAPKAYDGSMAAEIAERTGLSPEAAQTRVDQALAQRGSGPEMRTRNSNILMSSQDPEEVAARLRRLQTIDDATDRPMSEHVEGDGEMLYHLMNHTARATGNPQAALAVREKFLESRDQIEGNPETFYENLPAATSGIRAGQTKGRAGAMSVASDVWDLINSQDPSLETPGFFGINTDESFSDLPPAVQQKMVRMVNASAFMLGDKRASDAEIAGLAASMLKGQFGLELDSQGDPRVVIDQTPVVGVSADGQIQKGSKVTLDVLQKAQEDLNDPAASRVVAAIGGVGGFAQDTFTRQGGGLAVRSMAAGFPQDVTFVPGQRMTLPLSQIKDAPEAKFFTSIHVDEKSDAATVGVPPAPGPNDPTRKQLTDSLFMAYDPGIGAWRLRWMEKKDVKTIGDLGAESRQTEAERKARLNFGAMTDEELRRKALGGNREAGREIGRRRNAVEAPVGSPVPTPDQRGDLSPEEDAGGREIGERVLKEFGTRGIVDPESGLETSREGDLLSQTEEALFLTKSKGDWLDDQTKPERDKLMTKTAEVISDFEGRVPYAYDDHTGKRWTRSGKGDPTVGVGFNLSRPDADKLLKEIGVKRGDVLSGKVELTEAQQDQLLDLSMRETSNWLRGHFQGVDMENHRWMALLSLAFNSRWNDRGPTLIGPRLTAAIREGRWEDAAIEIEENSAGGVPNRLLAGIKARRRKEANLFRGAVI